MHFLNVLAKIQQSLIGNGHALVGFLLVCSDEQLEEDGSGEEDEMSMYEFKSLMTVPLKNGVRIDADSM